MRRLAQCVTIFASCLVLSVDASANPVIFVPESDGYAWWSREHVIRPTAKSVLGVSVETVNVWLASKRGMRDPEKLCFVEAVSDGGVVSPKRTTQLEIDATLKEFPSSFYQAYTTKTGSKFHVRVVVFETCGSEPRAGTALLITDSNGLFASFLESDFQFTRLFSTNDGKLNVFGCFNCGDVSQLNFNPENGDFYLKWVGH